MKPLSDSSARLSNLRQRSALLVLIGVELIAFGYMSRTLVFPLIVAAAAIYGRFQRRRIVVSSERRFIMALLVAAIFIMAWRVNPYTQPLDPMPYLSPLLHVLGQYLLILQVATFYFRFEHDRLPLSLPWLGVFVMVSAGDVSADPIERVMFQVLAIGFIAATAVYFSATARRLVPFARMHGWGNQLATLMILALTAGVAVAGSQALNQFERELNRIFSELLSPAFAASGAGFPSRSQLGSISEQKSAQADEIALRIDSHDQPGYWRGKSYHWMGASNDEHGGDYTIWKELPTARESEIPAGFHDQSRQPVDFNDPWYEFQLASSPNSTSDHHYHVWLSNSLWGQYFLPPQATTLYSPENQIQYDWREVKSMPSFDVIHYRVDRNPLAASDPLVRVSEAPGIFSHDQLTYVPTANGLAGGDPEIQRVANDVFKNCHSVTECIAAIELYFHTHYQYREGIQVPRNVDPVRWFLLKKPPAHCEYFAQAAGLLLRMRGIPTRYVTGFVVNEKNNYGNFWIARNRHAHAWCEAWDPQFGWRLVEATPANGVPSPQERASLRQFWEYLQNSLHTFRVQFAEGGIRWLFAQLLKWSTTTVGWIVLSAITAYLAVRLWMIRRASQHTPVSKPVRRLRALLLKMDRKLARRGMTRQPGETLHQFSSRIVHDLGDTDIGQWYQDYANTRFRSVPSDDTIDQLAMRMPKVHGT